MYHSYRIKENYCTTEDFNGDEAIEFTIVLGGKGADKMREVLELLLENGLDKGVDEL